MKPKHAEVLIAIAEGREVEFYTSANGWTEFSGSLINPIAHVRLEWRVKKKPVVEVKYFQLESKTANGFANERLVHDLQKWDIKATFEDGVAVKAEFPKVD